MNGPAFSPVANAAAPVAPKSQLRAEFDFNLIRAFLLLNGWFTWLPFLTFDSLENRLSFPPPLIRHGRPTLRQTPEFRSDSDLKGFPHIGTARRQPLMCCHGEFTGMRFAKPALNCIMGHGTVVTEIT